MRRDLRKNRIAWALIILGLAALYFFENNTATRALLIAGVLLPVLSGAGYLWCARGAAFILSAETSEPKQIRLKLRMNKAFRFAWAVFSLETENRFTRQRTEETLPAPSGKAEKDILLRAECCGLYEMNAKLLLQDALGLFSSEIPAESAARVLVLPQLYLPKVRFLEEMDSGEGETYSRERPGRDPGEFFGVREYVPGDPIRQIHWKLSEKTDKAMVREFGLPVSHRTALIFAGLGASDGGALDAMAKAWFSVSRSLAASQEPHLLRWQPEGSPAVSCPVHGSEDVEGAMELFFSRPLDMERMPALPAGETPAAHALLVMGRFPGPHDAAGYGRRLTVLSPAPDKPAGAGYAAVSLDARDPQKLNTLEL